jgi:hypothetical protein
VSTHKERAIPLPQMALHGNAAILSSAMSAAVRISGYGLLQTTRFRQRLLERPIQLEGPELDHLERRPAGSAFRSLPQLRHSLETHLRMTIRAGSLQHLLASGEGRPPFTRTNLIAILRKCRGPTVQRAFESPPKHIIFVQPVAGRPKGRIRLAVMATCRGCGRLGGSR